VVGFDPHQLDFDWRFTNTSINTIMQHVGRLDRLLLIGCPSLMNVAALNISNGLLIERNPYHDCCEKFSIIRADARYYTARAKHRNGFDAAIFDAPWYPNEFLRWADLALSYVHRGGRVLFVLWPESTRPTAKCEHEKILSVLREVGSLEQLGRVSYRVPHFEEVSLELNPASRNFQREGLLFSLQKNIDAPLPKVEFRRSQNAWRRYQISGQQLAIKIYPSVKGRAQSSKFEIEPHVLNNTSRRNAELQLINAWGSNNVVARLNNPNFLDREIGKLSRGASSKIGVELLAELGLFSNEKKVEWGRTWIHRL
jgi:hypothetical protein